VFKAKTIARLVFLCSIPLLLPGCGKKTEPRGPATSAVSTAPGGQPGEADLETVLRELTQALRKYSVEHKRVPKTFDEVVGAGYVKQLPKPPPDKKFEIDPKSMQVVLVKR